MQAERDREGAELELPEADIKLAIVVMQQYSHLLDEVMKHMLKAVSKRLVPTP